MKNLIKYGFIAVVSCFLLSCERPQEIKKGQIWRYYGESRNNPFETEKDIYYEVTDVKGKWCSYITSDGDTSSFRSYLMRTNAECTNCN